MEKIVNSFSFFFNRAILLSFIQRTTHLTVGSIQLHESHSDSELAAAAQDEKATAPKRSETFGGFDRRPSQKTRRDTATIMEGTTEGNKVSQRRDSGFSSTSLTSKNFPLNVGLCCEDMCPLTSGKVME